MSRRIEALKNLAERGATEGEREAARKALEIHMRKAGASRSQTFVPPSHVGAHWDRAGLNDWSKAHDDFLDTILRNASNRAAGPRFWKPFETGPKVKTHRRKSTVYGHHYDFAVMDDVADFAPPPVPPKTWPEAVDVDDHPTEQARARLEVATRAEMFSRFRESKPITIRWRSHVWRTEGFAGTCEDKSVFPPRLYLTINTARLTRLD